MMNAEQREIGLDQLDHRRDRLRLERLQPLALGRVDVGVAIFRRQRLPHGHQIIARIQPFRDVADLLAQRLAIAKMRRSRQGLDLAPGIVDIIFASDDEPGRFEQGSQRIADHRASAMTHVHRPGRVGRDIFDIDPFARTNARPAVSRPVRHDRPQLIAPRDFIEPHIDEPRPGNLDPRDPRQCLQLGRDQRGERARIGRGGLGQHHCRIGRKIAMRRIAR